MNKQIKDILLKSPINIKCKNFNSWEKEKVTNLYDACEHYGITIRKKADRISIKLDKWGVKITHLTTSRSQNFEIDVVTFIAMFCQYLGDKTTITTRFGTCTINH